MSAAAVDLHAVQASARAYRDAEFDCGHVEGVFELGPSNNYLMVAWRGTERDGADILADIRCVPWWSANAGAWCHKGFLAAARQSWARLEETLTGPGRPPIILTGHSLGGAIATITAAMMVQAGHPPRRLVTFGSPRAGFAGLGQVVRDGKVIVRRYTYGADIVPSMPPPGLALLRYRHVGREISLGVGQGDGFFDHRIADYQDAMWALGARPGGDRAATNDGARETRRP